MAAQHTQHRVCPITEEEWLAPTEHFAFDRHNHLLRGKEPGKERVITRILDLGSHFNGLDTERSSIDCYPSAGPDISDDEILQ